MLLNVVVQACNPSTVEAEAEGSRFDASLGYIVSSRPAGLHSETLSQKNKIRTGNMVQVVECLPCKLKALNSNPITTKKTKQEYVMTYQFTRLPIALRVT
jgi:hypothetical protein